ncbi:MAG: PilN domain-containing protein [Phycisphaerales bacterium]
MSLNLNPNHGNASFLPEEYIKSKGQARANIVALLLFGAVSVGTVGAFVYNYKRKVDLAHEVRQVRVEFEEASQKIDQLRALEKQRIDILERAEVVTAIIEQVPRSVLLAEIVRGMPEQVALTEFEMDGERVKVAPKASTDKQAKSKSVRGAKVVKKDETPEDQQKVLPPRFEHMITLTGLATLNNDVADYLEHLKNSPLLSNVELQYINETSIDEAELRKFRITMKIRESADLGKVASATETTLLSDEEVSGLTLVPTTDE